MKKLLSAFLGLSLLAVGCESHEKKIHEKHETAPVEHKEIKAPETKANEIKANEIKSAVKPAVPTGK